MTVKKEKCYEMDKHHQRHWCTTGERYKLQTANEYVNVCECVLSVIFGNFFL